MVLSPMVYALLEPTAFAIPGNPGPVAVYNQFATPAAIKTADNLFKRLQNEHQSYEKIRRACFRMLDTNIADQFNVSNVPTLIGWNQSMSIINILDQLDSTYGKPDTITLLNNNTLFRSAFNPTDAPESLFYRIEQCQEIQVLAQDPYSDMQIINNAVRLWMQASIFPLKEFDDWEAITPKTYTALKTFIAGAFTSRILAQQLRNTAGQMGYTPQNNMYTILGDDDNDDTTATDTTLTHTAMMNAAMASTGNATTAATSLHESVINAINQLNANQALMVQQMAALSLNNAQRPPAQIMVPVPQMQQLTIPTQVPYAGAAMPTAFNMGRGGCVGRGGRGGQSRGGGRGQRTPFATHLQNQAQGRGGSGNNGGIPIAPGGAGIVGQPATQAAAYSNVTKMFANWNVCYTCEFDIEDGHTSVTCPRGWCKPNHQEGFDRSNAQAYINAGWKPSTKGRHKTQFPGF
jgi:hypothetical protein